MYFIYSCEMPVTFPIIITYCSSPLYIFIINGLCILNQKPCSVHQLSCGIHKDNHIKEASKYMYGYLTLIVVIQVLACVWDGME